MMKLLFLSTLASVFIAGGSALAESLRPDVPPFYTSLDVVKTAMEGRCSTMEVRDLDKLLDVTRHRQQQIDCHGFVYRGAPRFMELMFSDGELDLVIVLIEEDEYADLENEFRKSYGKPAREGDTEFEAWFRKSYGKLKHDSNIGLFFYVDAVGVRTRPHEVVFTSKRTRANYMLYMDQMGRDASTE